jgi:hypothetical protein
MNLPAGTRLGLGVNVAFTIKMTPDGKAYA